MCLGGDSQPAQQIQSSNIPQWMQDMGASNASSAQAIAARPYQTYSGQRVQPMSGDQTSAIAKTESSQGQWQPNVNAATGMANTAATPNTSTLTASPITGSTVGTGSVSNSMPLLNPGSYNPGSVTPGSIAGTDLSKYMNPYTSQVVQNSNNEISRNLGTQLSSINQTAGARGANNSTRADLMGQEARRSADLAIGNNSTAGYAAAYQNAQAAAGQDVNTNLAGQVQNQNAGLQGANLNMNSAIQSFMANAGVMTSDQARQLQADLANQGNNLNVGTANAANNLNTFNANNAVNSTNRQLALSSGNLLDQNAQVGQGLNMNDIAALFGMGQQQQNQGQQNLTLSYQDFLNQQNYPLEMQNVLNSTLSGTPYSTTRLNTSTPGGSTSAQNLGAFASLLGGVGSLGGNQGIGGLSSIFGNTSGA